MSWLSDASANRINKAYINNFFDLSGNFKVRNALTTTTGGDDGGSSAVDTTGASWTQMGSDIDGTFANDYFGYGTDLNSDGTILAAGAYNHNSGRGEVRVYEWNGSSWTQLGGTLDGEAGGDYFGISVALNDDGTILAVGAQLNDGGGGNSGHVRVYEYNGSSWSQLGSDINGRSGNHMFGVDVALNGDGTIFAAGGFNGNYTRVFQYANSTWTQIGSDIDGEVSGDHFGWRVALSNDGTIVAASARYNDGAASNAGHVRIFEYSGGSWSQLGSDIDGEGSGTMAGWSIDLNYDGTSIIVGCIENSTGPGGSRAGEAQVFNWDGSSWNQVGSDIHGDSSSDRLGIGVAMNNDGTIIGVGARFANGSNGSNSGIARIYHWDGTSWNQVGSDISGEASDDQGGNSIALSDDGTKFLWNAYFNDGAGSNAGHVRVFDGGFTGSGTSSSGSSELVTTTASTTDVTLDITNSTITMIDEKVIPGDSYTIASTGGITRDTERSSNIDMNDDGTVMVVGHQLGYNSDGTRNGTTTVWTNTSGSTWTQIGSLLEVSEADHGRFQGPIEHTYGWPPSITSDGNRILVGWRTGDTTDFTGLYKVYDYVNSDWEQVGNDIVGGYQEQIRNGFMSKDGTTISYASPTSNYVKFLQYDSTTNDWSVFSTLTNHYSAPILNGNGTIRAENNSYSGSDYSLKVWKYENNAWSQLGQALNSTESNTYFKVFDLNYAGNILVAGDQESYDDTGVLRVYEYNSGNDEWSQLGSDVTNPFTYFERYYGRQTAKISDEGNVLVTSDYLARGPNYFGNEGGVVAFAYIDGDWSQIFLTYGTAWNVTIGVVVAISGDGTRFAEGSGSSPSAANTYSITRSTTTQPKTMVIEESKSVTNGTSWINRGQSGGTVSESYQKGLIIESSSSSANDAVLHVETSGQTQAFSIRGDGVLYADNTLQYSSDDRRKIEEQYITNATETIQKLSPQIYTKLNKFVENGGIPTKTESGLIAQEVYYNAPELVHLVNIEDSKLGKIYMPRKYDLSGNDIQQDPDYSALGWGDKSATMDYIGLIPYLIKSNQEQDALIKARQTSIDEQAQLIQQFQERVVALENK